MKITRIWPYAILVIGIGCIVLVASLGDFILYQCGAKKMAIERTFGMIKPEAVRMGNTGKIIDRIEQEGFTIVGLKKMQMTKELAELFYEAHCEKPFFYELVESVVSGPVVVMILERDEAIARWRDLMGATNPADAAPETLRKLYGTSITNNATHGSDSPETAETEISLIFPEFM